MTEKNLLSNLANKIQDDKMEYIISNLIYHYYCSNLNSEDNLNNLNLIGMGEIVNSNQQLQEDSIGTEIDDLMHNEQFLLIKNAKTKVYFGFLLAAADIAPNEKNVFFPYGYPVYEEIGEGIKSKNNKVYGNLLNEQVEINKFYFSTAIPFTNFLSPYHKILSDVIYKENSNKDLDPLSKFEKKAQQIYNSKGISR